MTHRPPQLNVETVEDKYVLYCLVYGIDSKTFWYSPITSVDRILSGKQAYDTWSNNPK